MLLVLLFSFWQNQCRQEGHSFWSLRRAFSWATNEDSSKVGGERASSESSATLPHEKVSLPPLAVSVAAEDPRTGCTAGAGSTAGWRVSHRGCSDSDRQRFRSPSVLEEEWLQSLAKMAYSPSPSTQ